jgi:hypothetical protein
MTDTNTDIMKNEPVLLNLHQIYSREIGFHIKHHVAEILDSMWSRSWYLSTVTKADTTFGKGKAVPLPAWSGPEGSRKLSFPDFLITAQDGCKVVSPTHRPHLPQGNTPGTHFC